MKNKMIQIYRANTINFIAAADLRARPVSWRRELGLPRDLPDRLVIDWGGQKLVDLGQIAEAGGKAEIDLFYRLETQGTKIIQVGLAELIGQAKAEKHSFLARAVEALKHRGDATGRTIRWEKGLEADSGGRPLLQQLLAETAALAGRAHPFFLPLTGAGETGAADGTHLLRNLYAHFAQDRAGDNRDQDRKDTILEKLGFDPPDFPRAVWLAEMNRMKKIEFTRVPAWVQRSILEEIVVTLGLSGFGVIQPEHLLSVNSPELGRIPEKMYGWYAQRPEKEVSGTIGFMLRRLGLADRPQNTAGWLARLKKKGKELPWREVPRQVAAGLLRELADLEGISFRVEDGRTEIKKKLAHPWFLRTEHLLGIRLESIGKSLSGLYNSFGHRDGRPEDGTLIQDLLKYYGLGPEGIAREEWFKYIRETERVDWGRIPAEIQREAVWLLTRQAGGGTDGGDKKSLPHPIFLASEDYLKVKVEGIGKTLTGLYKWHHGRTDPGRRPTTELIMERLGFTAAGVGAIGDWLRGIRDSRCQFDLGRAPGRVQLYLLRRLAEASGKDIRRLKEWNMTIRLEEIGQSLWSLYLNWKKSVEGRGLTARPIDFMVNSLLVEEADGFPGDRARPDRTAGRADERQTPAAMTQGEAPEERTEDPGWPAGLTAREAGSAQKLAGRLAGIPVYYQHDFVEALSELAVYLARENQGQAGRIREKYFLILDEIRRRDPETGRAAVKALEEYFLALASARINAASELAWLVRVWDLAAEDDGKYIVAKDENAIKKNFVRIGGGASGDERRSGR